MKNQYFAEGHQIKAGVAVGTDMNAAAITGARVALKKFDRVAIVIEMGASTGAVASFTLRQHNAASSGTSKDIVVANPYYKKVGAADVFTKVEPTVAAAAYDLSADFAGAAGLVIFEVLGEDLDVDGGFAFASVDVADSTAAKLIAIHYVLCNPRLGPAYNVATI